jgi:Abortive infection alpha
MSDEHDNGPQGLDAVAGVARIALSVWWHASEWAVRSSLVIPRTVLELALDPDKALAFARDLRDAVPGGPERAPADPRAPGGASLNGSSNGYHQAAASTLREEGAELLRRSRDVHYEIEAHPAYGRILSELAPDEGRILRLLLLEGPQPAVDVRTGGPVGIVRSRLLAPGLSMIGARAGCRYVERVPSYLNNLFRLGMVWFSRETLRDPQRYQVLEAQPDVLEAIKSVRQAKVVRRSIHLTPFGEDFCRVCLSADDAVLEELPAHSKPPEVTTASQPPELADA